MILAIAYLLLLRSSVSSQTMPVTFILMLGVACGFAGKLCIDTLGGSGYHWLLYWEVLCLLHFFSSVRTSDLFHILYGPISVFHGGAMEKTMFPYWIRRFFFYAVVLLLLPMICGLVPFASPAEWKDHLSLKVMDLLQPTSEWDWSWQKEPIPFWLSSKLFSLVTLLCDSDSDSRTLLCLAKSGQVNSNGCASLTYWSISLRNVDSVWLVLNQVFVSADARWTVTFCQPCWMERLLCVRGDSFLQTMSDWNWSLLLW